MCGRLQSSSQPPSFNQPNVSTKFTLTTAGATHRSWPGLYSAKSCHTQADLTSFWFTGIISLSASTEKLFKALLLQNASSVLASNPILYRRAYHHRLHPSAKWNQCNVWCYLKSCSGLSSQREWSTRYVSPAASAQKRPKLSQQCLQQPHPLRVNTPDLYGLMELPKFKIIF